MLHASKDRKSLFTAKRFFTILHAANGRRSLLIAIRFFIIFHCQFSPFFCSSLIRIRIGEASNPGPRFRRRGPRSALATERRAATIRRSQGQSQDPGLDGINYWSDAKFRILLVNIRGWTSHAAELTARIRRMDQKPDFICVNETFLNQAIEHIRLEGYSVIARRNRSDGCKC